MRLIADGVVDREGVAGLARRLCYTERHLHRLLAAEVGAGPLALARARRAHTARLLIETTELPISEVAFASGFASIRQFNDTIREVFATAPRELRRGQGRWGETAQGEILLRLPFRMPLDAGGVLRFLGDRAVAGVEEFAGGTYRRTLRLAHGAGTVTLSDGGDHVRCVLRLEDLRDLGSAVQRCRGLLDLDADPVAIAETLVTDPLLAPIMERSPGRRVPGRVDGAELGVRALLGQQVSVAAARTLAGRLVFRCGEPLPESLAEPDRGLTHLFPEPGAVAEIEAADLAMPAARREALRNLALAMARGEIVLDPGSDREENPPEVAFAAGSRPVDRVLRRHAGARRPGRLPDHGSRGAARPPQSRLCGRPCGRGRARRRVEDLARLRDAAPVGQPGRHVRDPRTYEKRGGSVKAYVDEIQSPAGPLAFAVNEEGALLWLQFTEGDYGRTIAEELASEGFEVCEDASKTGPAREELSQYSAGERRTFGLPLALTGSEWQKAVWEALTRIPFGETRSYGEIAAMVGRAGAARAVGRANSTNRLPLVVPCHRVIGANGTLTGFAGGVHLKTRLLDHERRVLAFNGA
jgi:AraC family transcriptional regulator of adaptative response / DNA-3-methyladenine glycosylase II